MKTFWTKKNIAIVLAVLLVAAVVVLCIALRQKSVEDTEPTLTLTCQSADADGACTVDVVLSGLPDGAHYEAASLAVAFDPTQITFLGTADGDIPLVMGSLPEWESDSERANETAARAPCACRRRAARSPHRRAACSCGCAFSLPTVWRRRR